MPQDPKDVSILHNIEPQKYLIIKRVLLKGAMILSLVGCGFNYTYIGSQSFSENELKTKLSKDEKVCEKSVGKTLEQLEESCNKKSCQLYYQLIKDCMKGRGW